MKLSQIEKRDVDAYEHGRWFDFDEGPEHGGFSLKLRGWESKKNLLDLDKFNSSRGALSRKTRPKRLRENSRKWLATNIIVDWKGFTHEVDGVDVQFPYSRENAIKIFCDPANAQLFEDVLQVVNDESSFGVVESEAQGNS